MENLFSPSRNKDEMNAGRDFVRISSFYNRCQWLYPGDVVLTKRFILGLDYKPRAENGKPVCYNVSVAGNRATTLFDMVRQ